MCICPLKSKCYHISSFSCCAREQTMVLGKETMATNDGKDEMKILDEENPEVCEKANTGNKEVDTLMM